MSTMPNLEEHTEDEDVIKAYTLTDDLSPDNVLTYCLGNLSSVTLIGRTKSTGEWYFASSHTDASRINFDLDKFKHTVMEQT